MSTAILFVASNAGGDRQVEEAFRRSGYVLAPCEGFSAGRRALHDERYALAVVDDALPDGSGEDLLVSAKGTPFILLSTALDVHARLDVLRAGAADCIGKPYDPLHLVARSVSVINRGRGMPSVSAPGFSRRLMVVDDSATYAAALAEELRRDGHDVALARAGHEAIAFGLVQELDLIVVDAFLPDMSGVDLCSRIRAIPALRRVPLLMLTGREKSAVRGRALEAEATELLVKSRDLDTVRIHVRRMLTSDERGAPSSRRAPVELTRSVPPPPSQQPASQRAPSLSSQPSVPPPSSYRSVPPPSVHGGPASGPTAWAPAEPSRRDGPPSSRSVPPSSRQAPPPSSRRFGRPDPVLGSDSGKSSSRPNSPLVEQLAAASGLSKLVARGAVERACWRIGIKPSVLTRGDLPRIIPELEQAMRVFLPPDVIALRIADMARIGKG